MPRRLLLFLLFIVYCPLPIVHAAAGDLLLSFPPPERLVGHTDSIWAAAFSPDGRFIVSGSWDGTLKLWDAETGAELRTLVGHIGSVTAAAFSPDGRFVISGSGDDTLKMWDTETGAELRTLAGHTNPVLAASFSPDGRFIVSGSSDDTLKLWPVLREVEVERDAEISAELRTLAGHAGGVNAATLSPDGRFIVSGSEDGTLKLWDAETGAELRTLDGNNRINAAAFSPDGRFIISGNGYPDCTLKLWDAETGEELRTLGYNHFIWDLALSPDGRFIVSGSSDDTLKLWDAETGAELRTLAGHAGYVNAAAFSPDGRFIVSGGGDDTLKLWDAETGAELRTLARHTGNVNAAAFSPDGRFIYSGSQDRTIKVWDSGIATACLQSGSPVCMTLNQSVYSGGQGFVLGMDLNSPLTADVYVALVFPGGIFHTVQYPFGLSAPNRAEPYRAGLRVDQARSYEILNLNIPYGLPSGNYSACGVLVEPGAEPLAQGNWMGWNCQDFVLE